MLCIVVILGPLWNTFVSSLRVYEQASIQGTEDSYEGSYDSDGSEKSLDSFVIQVRVAAVCDVYFVNYFIVHVLFCSCPKFYLQSRFSGFLFPF